MVEEKLKEEFITHKIHEILIYMSINKVPWNIAMPIPLHIITGCPHPSIAEMINCKRDNMGYQA